MVISYKSTLSKDNIQILPAVKIDEEWESKVKYEDKPFMFSTPRCKIVKDTKTLVVKKSEFKKFLHDIQCCLIDNITENSKTIFNGKTFSREKIEKSLETLYDDDDSGFIYLSLGVKDNVRCVDPLDNTITYDELTEEVTAVLHFQKIVFIKSNFKIVLKISHLKMPKFKETHVSFENLENDNFFD